MWDGTFYTFQIRFSITLLSTSPLTPLFPFSFYVPLPRCGVLWVSGNTQVKDLLF